MAMLAPELVDTYVGQVGQRGGIWNMNCPPHHFACMAQVCPNYLCGGLVSTVLGSTPPVVCLAICMSI